MRNLEAYEAVVGKVAIDQLRRLGDRLRGTRVVHVNSTREGGGVAEILSWMVPLMLELGLETSWEVIEGPPAFYRTTKEIHNALHGQALEIGRRDWDRFLAVNERNARDLRDRLAEAEIVVIHDPQPAALIRYLPKRRGRWIWRGHIDISRPARGVWKELRSHIQLHDASVFSMPEFAQPLPHPQFIISPSIDPMSDKNCELDPGELEAVRERHGLDPDRPLLVQISRFDRMKDPLGVIAAWRLVRRVQPVQLVLAGGGASDDPEGQEVLAEVRAAAEGESDLHVVELPPTAHREVNALQRLADIVIQKSLREGFGLTVAEGLWKGKPVIGGDTGGIRLQVAHYHTGFLVNTPEGAAHRIRYLLDDPALMRSIGAEAREFARENLLLNRQLREYLTLLIALCRGDLSASIMV